MTPIQYFLLILVLAIFTVGAVKAWAIQYDEYSPDEALWLDGRTVMIFYLDVIPCGNEKFTLGCFEPMTDTIYILKGWEFKWATIGCTIRDHEIFHALGYDHVSMSKFNCPNPNETDWEALQYNSNDVKHWDPMYIHTPRETDPRAVSWYVGERD